MKRELGHQGQARPLKKITIPVRFLVTISELMLGLMAGFTIESRKCTEYDARIRRTL